MNRSRLLIIIIILAAIAVIAGILIRFAAKNPIRQTEQNNRDAQPDNKEAPSLADAIAAAPAGSILSKRQNVPAFSTNNMDSFVPRERIVPSKLTGAALNGETLAAQRTTLIDGFYYEPLSDRLRRYMTGISFPSDNQEGSEKKAAQNLEISLDDLRYLHILHYDFGGNPAEGELVCNKTIAKDLAEIFYELYQNKYPIEKVLLIDKYNGNDTASMEDNNTSCFNYRPVEGTSSLSKHALGLAVDINPLYNPYITYRNDGTQNVSPSAAFTYADRSADFLHKIDADDLCFQLFAEHGFTWGGNWNSVKDYQHFQKTP